MKRIQYVATVIVFSSLLICANAVADEAPQEKVERFRFGVGLGVPYGIIGLNLAYQINDFFEANAGFGSPPGYRGLDWVLGGRFYPIPKFKRFRPRLSALYGVVGAVRDINDDIIDVYDGPAIGAGFIWKFFRRHSIDLDIFYSTAKPPDMVSGFKTEGENQHFFSFGYGYHF